MTFLAPWAGWFIAGIPVIVLLYLLKLKRRSVTVSTLLFWQRVLQENRRRALFQRLRHLLSLLLHLLIFLLLLAALAKPAFDHLVRAGSSVVIVLDTRARMQAIEENGDTRYLRAVREARELIRGANARRPMALLGAGAASTVTVPFTGDEQALARGLETLVPTDAAGDLAPALDLAASLLASRQGEGRIVVLTDRPAAAPFPNAEFIPVGSSRDNVAITRFAARTLLNSAQTMEVLLTVRNFGAAPAAGNVDLLFDGKLLDVKPFALGAGEEKTQSFPSVPRQQRAARGWLTARLDRPDALAVDDAAFTVLPAAEPHRVLLVSQGNWFVEKLLAADQQIEFELLEPGSFQSGLAAKFDAVVFDNFLPGDFDLSQSAGNLFFLKRSPFSISGNALEQPVVTDLESAHPALRLVNLHNVTIVRAQAAQVPPSAPAGWQFEVPLRSFDRPLLITASRRTDAGTQRLAALTFDLGESDLPLRVAFPLLMTNTLHWLAGERSEIRTSLRAGETLSVPDGQTVWTQPQTRAELPVNPSPAELATGFFRPWKNGYYLIGSGERARWMAVNTFSESESDLRLPPVEAAPRLRLPGVGLSALSGWPIWHYLALAAFGLFSMEWWLFHRRRTE